MTTKFSELVEVEYPIIMAPMFLISDTKMTISALNNGISAAIPALNYRTLAELSDAIDQIRAQSDKPFGINLIVNKSNILYPKQLDLLLEKNIDYIITSLGSPKMVIEKCKPKGILVFCDVTDLDYAKKVEDMGADAVIAVSQEAGGHCGFLSKKELIPLLVNNIKIPVIAAGNIVSKKDVDECLALGAIAVSVGTIFIASSEAPVSKEYKQALVDYGEDDIAITTKLSGSHLTVIKTPYVIKNGLKASWLEKFLKYKPLKKYVKMLISLQGLNSLKNAATSATYKTYFVAGRSIRAIQKIEPISEIIKKLVS